LRMNEPRIVTFADYMHGVEEIDPETGALLYTGEASGAIPNGKRVEKIVLEKGDYHGVGEQATVLGSMGPIEGEFAYCVRWDDSPIPVFVRGRKVRAL
jgi:hypothetical protein